VYFIKENVDKDFYEEYLPKLLDSIDNEEDKELIKCL
jgi:hypothetical protein